MTQAGDQVETARREDSRSRAKRAAGRRVAAGAPARRSLPLSVLLVVLTMVVLAPFLALEAFNLRAQVRSQRAGEVARLSALAADLAQSVDRELRGQIRIADMMSASRSLQRGDLARFREHAEDAESRTGGISS
jgi:hypothetical protein